MTPLPPNSTARFRAHYTVLGHQHTMQLRSHASPAVVGGIYHDLFGAFDATVANITFDTMDFAAEGSDIFNPVSSGHDGTTYTGGTAVPENAAWQYTFLGRTSGGKRVRLSMFGALFLTTDYRISASESSPIDTCRGVLIAAGSNIIAIDGLTPVWKTYVDAGVNDHWVKRLRV